MNTPTNLKYSKTDEWVNVDGNIATIGISDYAQDQLSDIVFVEIVVAVGDTVKPGDTLASLESVKAAADVNCPVSGKVVEINEALAQTPEVVNSDPYGKAWMVKVELANTSELETLMDASSYEKYCAERSH
ncbi:MAG: glycine cleavage system protein GcvH [Anaerolineales bacterium]|jgi:glycine cleavage system H protein